MLRALEALLRRLHNVGLGNEMARRERVFEKVVAKRVDRLGFRRHFNALVGIL